MRAQERKKHVISLKWGLLGIVLLCWVVPLLLEVVAAGYLLSTNYEQNLRQTVEANAEHAMRQEEIRFQAALDASKAVSYDGVVRNAYRAYQKDSDQTALFSTVTDYLAQSYSRDENFKAVFITFLDQPDAVYANVSSHLATSYSMIQRYSSEICPQAMQMMQDVDTGIYFLNSGNELYMIRNLLDSQFKPYALLVMLCDVDALFQPLAAISSISDTQISVDGISVDLQPLLPVGEQSGEDVTEVLTQYTTDIDGHILVLTSKAMEMSLWGAMPELKLAIVTILLMGIPFLLLIVALFYRHVTHPVELLVQAASRVQSGEQGYVIHETPHNQEFRKLTRHFNSMSTELKNQFERLYLEQQASQEAQIKALQSQINPHFLNNTLEIINWEARLANNEKICAMIEALSTMLGAVMGRDGRAQIPLREELGYVDAYLYISKERLGERLSVSQQIDESLLDTAIPKLLLQPLVENAVDHDISKQRAGELLLRVYSKDGLIYLEVEHDGTLRPDDREKIQRLLAAQAGEGTDGHVGIRNVNQRLKLLYGEAYGLQIEEVRSGRILARAAFPLQKGVPASCM